jgi:hypothetical protein
MIKRMKEKPRYPYKCIRGADIKNVAGGLMTGLEVELQEKAV